MASAIRFGLLCPAKRCWRWHQPSDLACSVLPRDVEDGISHQIWLALSYQEMLKMASTIHQIWLALSYQEMLKMASTIHQIWLALSYQEVLKMASAIRFGLLCPTKRCWRWHQPSDLACSVPLSSVCVCVFDAWYWYGCLCCVWYDDVM